MAHPHFEARKLPTNHTLAVHFTRLYTCIPACLHFYSAPQCSHCEHCSSYVSSVHLSVRLSHAGIVATTAHSTVQFALSDSKINIPQERPLPPEILALSDLPLLMAASFDTFCFVAPQPQEIEKEVQLHLTKTRHRLSNKPSTKVLRCP